MTKSETIENVKKLDTCDYCGEPLDGLCKWTTDQDVTVLVCEQCNSMLKEHYGEDDFPPLELFEKEEN